MLIFTEILVSALLRATFARDLIWRSPGESFTIEAGAGCEQINDAFRFNETGQWLQFEASATSPTHDVPQARVRVSVPAGFDSEETGLRLANEVNRLGLSAVHFDAAREKLVVQQTIIYTGYHEASPIESDWGIRFAQREATLNMVVCVLATCENCLHHLHPESAGTLSLLRASPSSALRRHRGS